MQYRSKIHLLLVPFLLTLSSPSLAEEESPTTLSPVVVTAARSEQPIETAPAHVTVIELDDIRRSGARSILDVLKSESGIHIHNQLGNAKTANVDLRGFGETAGSNTLVLVDGRRVNAVDMSGTDWLQIPLEQIERIEIVRGTGSVLYGDNASGGVINIITRTPAPGIQAQLGTDFGSYDDDRQWMNLGGGTDLLAFSLSGSLQDSDGYRDNNFLDSKDLGGSLRFYPTDRLTLGLSGSIHEDEYGWPGPLSSDQLKENRKSANSSDSQTKTSDRYLRGISEYDFIKSGYIATDISIRDRESVSSSSFGKFISDLETTSIATKYSWDGNILNKSNNITTGIDLYFSDLDSTFSIEKDSIGLYLHDQIYFLESLIFNAGIRYEKADYKLSDINRIDRDFDETSWETGLSWLYSKQSSAYLRINTSFRYPMVDELVHWMTKEINYDFAPQTGKNYEIGIRHKFSPIFLGKASFFRTDIKNEIFYDPYAIDPITGFFGVNTNHPETSHEGIETGFELDLGDYFGLDANYTYTRAKFEAAPFNGNDIPAVPRHQASARLVVEDLYPGLTLSALYNYVGKRYAISDQANALGKVGSYDTVDLRAAFGRDHWSLYAGVNNLFDENYSDYVVAGSTGLNYYPAPERNWVAGLEVSF